MIKAIFFDFDGVICDTEPAFFEYKYNKMNEMGYPVTREFLLDRVGESFRVMFPKEFKSDNPEAVIEEYYDGVDKNITDYPSMIYPTLLQLLDYCKTQNIMMYVTSNSKHHRLLHALSDMKIDSYFKAVYSSEMLHIAKPDPLFYEKIAVLEHLKKEEVIIIEDSSHGISAAKNAGFFTIAKAEHYFGIDQSMADLQIEEHKEIINILEKMNH